MASHHKSAILTTDWIIDPYFYKTRRNQPWRVTTSQRLGRMIGSPILIFKILGETPLGESPQVNDLDK